MIDFNDNVARRHVGAHPGQARASGWSGKYPVANTPDARRVLALPRRQLELDGTERAETIIDMQTEKYARKGVTKCRCAELDPVRHEEEGCITRLRLVQAIALREISMIGGLLGPIGVGHGKTLIDLLAPMALAGLGITNIVLAVPPGLAKQLYGDYLYAGQHFHMAQIVFHGVQYTNTLEKMDPMVPLQRGAPVVHVVPYSRLSQPESTDWLERVLKPQAIISDEAHRLRNVNGAASGRIDRYNKEHPETLNICMSGSMTARKLRDYDHLARWTLKDGSPLPHDEYVTADWERVVVRNNDDIDPGPLEHLMAPGETLRAAFRRRVIETLGVVTTSAPAVDCQLTIRERPAPKIPPEIEKAIRMVRGLEEGGAQRPDGEILTDKLAEHRTMMQVICGFYYRWIFPRCEFPRDQELVQKWLDTRKAFNQEIRAKVKSRAEHMDSERLCLNAAERHYGLRPKKKGLPVWDMKTWPEWQKVKDTVYYTTQTVWLSDYLVNDVVAWAREAPGIVWYDHQAFADRVYQVSGIPVYGAGKDAKEALLGNPKKGIPGERGDRSILCSVKALGTGVNGLQHRYHRAHMPSPPASPDGWEQPIGRLHRVGQKAPEVSWEFYMHVKELRKHVSSALNAALYIEETLGATQKINMAMEIDPMDEMEDDD